MSAQSKTTIANLALREIGGTRIDDFNEVSPVADIVRDVWDHAVRKCLSQAEWSFATKATKLAQQAATVGGYDYSYELPGDLIRLIAVYDAEEMQTQLWDRDYVQRGMAIDTNSEHLWVDYVYYHDVPGAWPSWFTDVLVANLASSIAAPLKSSSERERLEQLATQRLRDAQSANAVQKPAIRMPDSHWNRAQFSGSGRYGPYI